MPIGNFLKCIAGTKHNIFLERLGINHKADGKTQFCESAGYAQAAHIQDIADGSVAQVAEVSFGIDIHIGINFGRRQGRDGSGRNQQSAITEKLRCNFVIY